ncbi:MAG: hypothetical protein PHF35_04285 [Candidatus Moranbacteria bacterium]|nr:hypothetical protein [Candidatus Moranbacteria bacterium]
MAQNLSGDLTRNPKMNVDLYTRPSEKIVYIKKNGEIDSFRGTDDKREINYVQKFKARIIEKDGKSHKWNFIYPKKLYLDFIKIKSLEELQKFVETNEFCIFPTTKETQNLGLEYEKVGLNRVPEFVVVQNKNLVQETRKKEAEIIFQINLKFIWDKKVELEDIVKRYADGKLEYHKLLWVNRNMENVSDSFYNSDHFAREEIRKGLEKKLAKDKRSMKKINGMEEIQKLPIVPAYNVYGHYALCCLEFYLDIMRKNKLIICNECDQINRVEPGQHSDRETCLPEENPGCARRVAAKIKAGHRKKK